MRPVTQLNYHHLRYFWAVAKEGSLTRAARALRVSQSALSSQIRQLEQHLDQPLFLRQGRRLELTEAGRMALEYADDIFEAGGELLATLTEGRRREHILSIGAVATLSRNFQESFIKPLLGDDGVRLRMVSGGLDDLLERLAAHELDLVLSNALVPAGADRPFRCRLLARQPVSLVGHPRERRLRFPDDLRETALLLPSADSEIRTSFDALCEGLGLTLNIHAEVDDMAMLRLLTRDTRAVALIPSVVVRDEIRAGILEEVAEVPDLVEAFYATTVERLYPHPLIAPLVARNETEILAMAEGMEDV